MSMNLLGKLKGQSRPVETAKEGTKTNNDGLEVKLPGCENFVPLGKAQYKKVFADDLGPRLLLVLDECAELLEPTGLKTTEGKEEDSLKQECTMLIKSITQLGRSSGMHIILAPLRLSTAVPLYDGGFTTMGEIQVGDRIYGPQMGETTVVAVAPIKMSDGMYDMTLQNVKTGTQVTIGADGDHNFPVYVREGLQKTQMRRVEGLWRQGYNLSIPGGESEWKIIEVKRVPDEPVRCIEVDCEEHQFMVCGDLDIEELENANDLSNLCVRNFNTQRNDASIIPGVIQNNSLSLDSKVLVKRKMD